MRRGGLGGHLDGRCDGLMLVDVGEVRWFLCVPFRVWKLEHCYLDLSSWKDMSVKSIAR